MRSIGVHRVWLLSITLLICGFGSYITWRASTTALAQTPCPTSGGVLAPTFMPFTNTPGLPPTLAVVPKGSTAPASSAGDPCATLTPPTDTATLAPRRATPTLIGSPGTRIPLVRESTATPTPALSRRTWLNSFTLDGLKKSRLPKPGQIVKIRKTPIAKAPQVTVNAALNPQAMILDNAGRIVFTSYVEEGSAYHLFTMNPDGSGVQRLTDPNYFASDELDPVLSPNGQQVAFTYHGIYVVNVDGSNPIDLSASWPASFQLYAYEPTWSPDGTKIAFVGLEYPSYQVGIWVMNVDGSNPTKIYDGGDWGRNPYLLYPDWSPDGTKIAFNHTNADSYNTTQIFTMNVDGSDVSCLTCDVPGYYDSFGVPRWSPDGQRISYVKRSPWDGEAIAVINADSSNEVVIYSFVNSERPWRTLFGPAAWSPDGSKLAFTLTTQEDEDDLEQIYTINADGSDVTNISSRTNDVQPDWGVAVEVCEPSGSAQRSGAVSPMSACQAPTATPSTPTPILIPPPVPLTGPQKVLMLLCQFSDIPIPSTPYTTSWFQGTMSNVYGGTEHYWGENSYGNVTYPGLNGNPPGSNVIDWFTINANASYINTSTGHFEKLTAATDCFSAASASYGTVLPSYDTNNNGTLVFVFNGLLEGPADNLTFGISVPPAYYDVNQPTHAYSAIYLSERGYRTGQDALLHEFGHKLSFNHSGGPYGADYDSRWDVMSDSQNGCIYDYTTNTFSGVTPPDPTYGCLPANTIAYNKYKDGWIPTNLHTIIAPNAKLSLTIQNLARPMSSWLPDESLIAMVPIQGSRQFYTVEARGIIGYDAHVPGIAVIIHLITPGQNPQILDIDDRQDGKGYMCNNGRRGNPNDSGAQWLVGDRFIDFDHNISVFMTEYHSDTGSFGLEVSNQVDALPSPTNCP
jgi:Tol biopolymer transport system component